jgi:hypothetical protein
MFEMQQRRKFYSYEWLYFKKSERSHINNLMMYLKVLEKQKQVKPKISRWEEMTKINVENKEGD